MAQYDGSIRINTQISTKEATAQLTTFGNRMVKAADKVAALRSRLESLKTVKIPTQEYQEIQKQIEVTEKKINDLMARQEKFLATGGKESSTAYKRMQYDLAELKNSLPYIKSELQELIDSGKAFTIGDPEGIARTEQQLRYAENDLAALNQRHDELIAKQSKSKEALSQKYDELITKQKRLSDGFKKMGGMARKAFSRLGDAAGKIAKTSFRSLGTAAKNAFSHINKGAKKSGGLMSSFMSRFKGLALSLLIFNQISKAFNTVVNSIKTGFGNLYNENERFKGSVNSLKASMATLQNAFAGAFRPLVEIAIPYIQRAVEWISRLIGAVGQLIAALTGRKTYTKAIQQTAAAFGDTANAADKAKKAIEGYLSPLDEINKFNKANEDGADSGAGAGGGGGGPMFEEVPISDKFKDIAQWLKDMWDKADFYELGQFLGERLKEALDNIPWDEIKATAKKIGKSLASLINGFIEVEGLGYTIGRTLAEAFNTGFEFLNAFVHELHWASLGQFIAESLNGIFENIDWPLIRDTFVTGAKGLGDAINSFVDYLNWPAIASTISNFVNTFVDTIYTFFTTIDWSKLGIKIRTLISDSIAKIDWYKAGQALGAGIQAIFDFLLATIGSINWGDIGTRIAYFLNGAVNSIDLTTAGRTLGGAITGLCDMAINFAKTFDWKALGDNISNGINGFFEKFDGAKFGKAANSLISGLLDMVNEALDKTDWEAIGRDVVDLFVNINWFELSAKLFDAAAEIIAGLFKGLIKAIADTDWGEVWSEFIETINKSWGDTREVYEDRLRSMKESTEWNFGKMKEKSAELGNEYDKLRGSTQSSFGKISTDIQSAAKSAVDSFGATKEKSTELGNEFGKLQGNAQSSFGGMGRSIQSSTESIGNSLGTAKDKSSELSSEFSRLQGDAQSSFDSIDSDVRSTTESVRNNLGETQDKTAGLGRKFGELQNTAQSSFDGMSYSAQSATETMRARLDSFIAKINETISSIGRLESKMSSISSRAAGTITDIGLNNISFQSASPYAGIPGIDSLANTKIPGYATGQVIPRNMQKHLAWLGDNNQETEVVSPLSTIKQANRESLLEVLSELGLTGGGRGGNTYNVRATARGKTIFDLVIEEGKLQQMATGRNPFNLGTT